MASATDVAHLFLSWANEDGDLITNLKMQKLLYYAQAWHSVNFGTPLFDDQIEAWDFGPVVRSAYSEFKEFGHSPISYDATGKEAKKFSPEQIEFLEEFYDKFIGYPAHLLVNMSHNEKPWKEAFNKGHKIISLKAMTDYYSSL